MKDSKEKELTGPKIYTLYEGASYEELMAVIKDFEEPVRDDLREIKKIKKGSFEKSFFRGNSKCTQIKKYK